MLPYITCLQQQHIHIEATVFYLVAEWSIFMMGSAQNVDWIVWWCQRVWYVHNVPFKPLHDHGIVSVLLILFSWLGILYILSRYTYLYEFRYTTCGLVVNKIFYAQAILLPERECAFSQWGFKKILSSWHQWFYHPLLWRKLYNI